METIKPQELRTGNILNYDTSEGEILQTFIDWQDLKWLEGDSKGFNLVHSKIPLTAEWLKKFGAKNTIDIYWISISNLKAEFHFEVYEKEIVTTIKSDFCNLILDQIKYVHELQNLYYALTKDELVLAAPPINTKTNDC